MGKLCEWLVFQDTGAKPQDRLIFWALEYSVVQQNFLWGWKCSLTVTSSHIWLLSTWNVASVTGELNVLTYIEIATCGSSLLIQNYCIIEFPFTYSSFRDTEMKYFSYPKIMLMSYSLKLSWNLLKFKQIMKLLANFRHQSFWIYVVPENIKDLGVWQVWLGWVMFGWWGGKA